MCKFSIFGNSFSKIEKTAITFSILKKKAHIKFSIFGNIFSKIEKAAITFSILEKIFSKNGN